MGSAATRRRVAGLTLAALAVAAGMVASVPAAVLLVVAQRYVAAGVTAGAVKH